MALLKKKGDTKSTNLFSQVVFTLHHRSSLIINLNLNDLLSCEFLQELKKVAGM